MGIPRSKANPAEVCFARLIFTNHMVAASVFFYCYLAFGTFLKSNYLIRSALVKIISIHHIIVNNFSLTFSHRQFLTLVLAAIQFEVSESSSHFLIHRLRRLHLTGSCQFSPQEKQNVWLHLHVTGRHSTCKTLIALLQSGEGHHLKRRLHYRDKCTCLYQGC